jgi:hypothetical protein
MNRALPLLISLAALAAVATPAQAAAKSCSRDGATLLDAGGKARVVSVKEKPQHSETRRVRIYGCWTSTGRRFTMFEARDFGLDEIERDSIQIIGGRFIGVVREFEGGASESQTAASWDAQKHVARFDTKPCDSVDAGDFSGVEEAVFTPTGGIAYTCGQLRVADGHGDRQLAPPGTIIQGLAFAGTRLYWSVFDSTGTVATPHTLVI